MRHNKFGNHVVRYFSYLLTATTMLGVTPLLTSCHDEPTQDTSTVPDDEDQLRFISFSLPSDHFTFGSTPTPVIVSLISTDGLTQVFNAIVEKKDGDLSFRMSIPSDISISNGRYIMTMRHENGECIAGRVSCSFENEALTSVNIILPTYMLSGSGTEDDPYIIANNSDFETFLINLADDTESFGAGLKFSQTADVVAPDQSPLITGRGYWGAPFAGIYDGGGHAITNLYYHGNNRENSDSGFGIFQKLLGSSTIENLSLTGVSVTGLYKESGMIAGSVSGDVVFRNISLSGNIEGGSSIGTLAGIVFGGNLTIDNVRFSATVSGNDNIGGLIGKVNNGAGITISNVTTPDYHFSVAGHNHVGGLIGENGASASFNNIRIEHKVSDEDSDIRIISGKGDGIGGLIGSVPNNTKNIIFSDCYVLCPLGGNDANSVGGLVGNVEGKEMHITNCRIYSVIAGKTYVGGLIGKATMPLLSPGLFISGEDFSTRIAVDDADAKVSGVDYVGGFAGWWEGNLSIEPQIKINAPIISSGSAAGGAFGGVYNSSVDATRFLIGSGGSGANTLHISGKKEVGGIVGRLWKSTLTSNSTFDFAVEGDNAKIPKVDQFHTAFDGVVTGTEAVGGLVGYGLIAEIRGAFSTAHITGTAEVGGIVGKMEDDAYNSSNVEDCTFNGILDCSEADKVGGIVGHYRSVGQGKVHDCVNYSNITGGDSEGGTAGIIGYISKTAPTNVKVLQVMWCANVGKINGLMHVGGIVGKSQEEDCYSSSGQVKEATISIYSCVNTASIYAEGGSSSSSAVGGILGFSNYLTRVAQCANHGEVYGHNACHGIGGIAGSMGEDPTGAGLVTQYLNVLLEECLNTASINAGARSSFVGGILGYQEEGNLSNVNNCVNHGRIVPNQDHDSGGIVGCVDHLTNIYRCVNKGKVEHGNAMIGTHKSGSIFYHDYLYYLEGTGSGWPSAKKLSSDLFTVEYQYNGFDFKDIWKMTSDGPMLRKNRWNYI